jgi:hypothetical protein
MAQVRVKPKSRNAAATQFRRNRRKIAEFAAGNCGFPQAMHSLRNCDNPRWQRAEAF